LISIARDQVTEFMWMLRVDLADGTTIEAYKHSRSRRYLYLDGSGCAYALVGDVTYEVGDPMVLLAEAMEQGGTRASIVRHNDWVDGENVTWARSATRHRVPRARTLFVVRSVGVCFEDGTGRSGEPRLFFFGDDKDGRQLEVAAFEEANGGLHVVHSMLLRPRFEERYREALRWRK
jgi:hypothetical protein